MDDHSNENADDDAEVADSCKDQCCICDKECHNEGFKLDDDEHIICDTSHEVEGRCKRCDKSLFGLSVQEEVMPWTNYLMQCNGDRIEYCQKHRRVAMAQVKECGHFLCSQCLSEMLCRRENNADDENDVSLQFTAAQDITRCSIEDCFTIIPTDILIPFSEYIHEILKKEMSEISKDDGQESCTICSQKLSGCVLKCGHHYCSVCLIDILKRKHSLQLPFDQNWETVLFCPVMKCCTWILLKDIFTFVTEPILQGRDAMKMLEDGKLCQISTCGSNAVVELPCTHSYCVECSNALLRFEPVYKFDHDGKTFNVIKCPDKSCNVYTCLGFIHQCFNDSSIPGIDKDETCSDGSTEAQSSLKDVGITCYCKSILQILARTPGFFDKLQSYSEDEKRKDTPIISLLYRILKTINKDMDKVKVIPWSSIEENVSGLIGMVYKADRSFMNDVQNDSHLFLMTLLKLIEQEVKNEGNGRFFIFDGIFRTTFRHTTCSHIESTAQLFRSIYIPLIEGERKDGFYDVEQTLVDLTWEDVFDQGQVPCKKCDNGQQDTITKMKMTISRSPDILLLQAGTAEKRILARKEKQKKHMRKKMDHVNYPMELSLRELKTVQSDKYDDEYDLYAIVMHSGIHRGGHYHTCIKSKHTRKWCYFDGSYVTLLYEDEVRHLPNVYLLFYSRTLT